MRRYIFGILLLATVLIQERLYAQSGQWVWLKGDSTGNAAGHYGIKGVPDAANEPPPSAYSAHWTDLDGNFWLFGCGASNDLWKYSPVTNTWTWMHGLPGPSPGIAVYGTLGVPSPLNVPPRLTSPAYWTDAAGDLWLFGGESSTFYLDALWRYHIATNEWTWMAGSPGAIPIIGIPPAVYGPIHTESNTNTPGGRAYTGAFKNWCVDNNLWLFGGYAYYGLKNDQWRYNLGTNQWAWEGGSQSFNSAGSYGIMGISNASNQPSSRNQASGWLDTDDNLCLFSGGPFNYALNDLWKYERASGQWTWSGGTSTPDDPGTGNAYCVPDAANLPYARHGLSITASNVTCTRAYWAFGGGGMFNDLWLFNTSNRAWSKIKGHSYNYAPYSYGIKGIAAATNLPKGRYGAAMWTDASGSVYMFGGGVPYSANPLFSIRINDLWKFIPDTACYYAALRLTEVQLVPPADTLLCAGDSIKMQIPINSNISVSPATGRNIDPAAGEITFYGGSNTTYTIVSDAGNPCASSGALSFTIALPSPAVADFTVSPAIAYLDNPVFNFVNRSSNAVRYEWFYKGQLLTTGIDLVHRFSSAGKHCIMLVAINECGERDSVSQCCEVLDKPAFFVPNAFSPNGDGINDRFQIEGGNIKVRTFEVYNRYGQTVFGTYHSAGKWDGNYKGEKCDVGTYYYCIRYVDIQTGEEHTAKGDVLLLR